MDRIDYVIVAPLNTMGQEMYYFQRKKMLEEIGLNTKLITYTEKVVFPKFAFFNSLKSGYKIKIHVKKYLKTTTPKTIEFQNNFAIFQETSIFEGFKTIISFDFPAFFEASKHAYILPLLEKRKFAMADILITRSRYAYDRLKFDYGEKIVHIPHAEDFSEMKKFGVSDRGYIVAYISSHVGGAFDKGLDILIKTWNIHREYDPKRKLMITGIDKMEAIEYLKLRKIEIPKTVSFYGKMDREKFLRIVSESSLLINTARKEPFGRTMLESMLLGTPVVATPTHGSKEIVGKIDKKLISESFLPSHIAENIRYCLANYTKNEKLKHFFQEELDEYRYERVKMKLKKLGT